MLTGTAHDRVSSTSQFIVSDIAGLAHDDVMDDDVSGVLVVPFFCMC